MYTVYMHVYYWMNKYVYVFSCIYICTYLFIYYIYMSTCIDICIYKHMHTSICIYIFVCICVYYIYVYIQCAHVCIYMNMHVHIRRDTHAFMWYKNTLCILICAHEVHVCTAWASLVQQLFDPTSLGKLVQACRVKDLLNQLEPFWFTKSLTRQAWIILQGQNVCWTNWNQSSPKHLWHCKLVQACRVEPESWLNQACSTNLWPGKLV